MMNANEARNKTDELIKINGNKKIESLRAWIEETCGGEIKKAVEACKFEVVVIVPNKHSIIDVTRELRHKGFTVNIHQYKSWGGFINQITISW